MIPVAPPALVIDDKVVGVNVPQLFWSPPITPGSITVIVSVDVLEQPVVVSVPVTI